MRASVSVVIPALNEAGHVGRAVASALAADEVIVVDGGSVDTTREEARRAGARVIVTSASRGLQLDAGARQASGDWLVFLHADTRLEAGWREAILGLDPTVAGGCFRLAIDSLRPAFRVIEAGVALRCRLVRLPYGDQALFARREVYARLGGFPHLPLMEDVCFVRRLAGAGRLAWLRERAFTSPRRWERHGAIGATLRNWWVLLQYAAGRSPEALACAYRAGSSRHLVKQITEIAARPGATWLS